MTQRLHYLLGMFVTMIQLVKTHSPTMKTLDILVETLIVVVKGYLVIWHASGLCTVTNYLPGAKLSHHES